MNKTYIILILLANMLTVKAQDVKFGLKGGVNFSNISISGGNSVTNPDTTTRTSFHLGGLVEVKLADKFALQPEIQYSSVGYKFALTGIEQGISYRGDVVDKIDYLSIPVLVKYFAAEGFSLDFGPQVGFLISHKADIKVNVLGNSSTQTVDLADESEKIEFGLNFGATYKFKNNLFLSGRYNLGLSNIQKESTDGEKILNRTFQLSLGYIFK